MLFDVEITYSKVYVEVTITKSYDISGGASREVHMNKNKHLTQSDRLMTEHHLNNKLSFKAIGRDLFKDPTTISKEVKNHISF